MKRFRSFSRWVIALSAVALAPGLLSAQLAILARPPALPVRLPVLETVWKHVRPNNPTGHPTVTAVWEQVRIRAASVVPGASSPADQIQAAWRRAQEAGAYRFATDIVQTTYPAPRLTNVGRSSRQDTLYIEGETNLPDRTMQIVLWQDGGSLLNPRDGVEIRIEGDQAYGRQIGGTWQEVDDFSGAFAPGQDLMAYLAGAKNVKREDVKREDLDSRFTHHASRFTFDVDGPAFGAYLRDQLERHLIEKGELPAGLTLDVSNEYRAVIGQGEVWIDEAGLPLRLRVHLEYPQDPNGERIAADIKTDFSDFAPLQMARNQVFGKNLQFSKFGKVPESF